MTDAGERRQRDGKAVGVRGEEVPGAEAGGGVRVHGGGAERAGASPTGLWAPAMARRPRPGSRGPSEKPRLSWAHCLGCPV